MTNFASRAIGLLVMMLSVSWTVPYLGAERFGAWMTVASFAGMLSFLDLGLGNALTNRVAQVASSDSPQALKNCISGGLGLLALVSVAISLPLTGLAFLLPWSEILSLKTPGLTEEVRATVMLFAILFGLMTFSGGIAKVFNGLQRGFEVHIAGIFGSLIGLLALAYAVHLQAGLPVLLLCTMGGPLLGNLLLLAPLLKRGEVSCHSAVQSLRSEAPNLINVGWLFLLLQIGTMVGWGADSLIIANATGAASVASFAVIQRLTLLVSQPLSIINAPLWSAYADAHGRGEKVFIRETFVKSFYLTLLASFAGAALLVAVGQDAITYWTDGKIKVELLLLVALAIWMILECTGNSLGVLLNGLGVVKQQVWIVSSFVLVAIPLKLWLSSLYGALGVVIAGIVAYLLTTVLGYGLIFRKAIAEKIK